MNKNSCRIGAGFVAVAALGLPALAQAQPAANPLTPPMATPIPTAGPGLVGPIQLSPEAREILQMLHDRKNTLKDFVAKIDYSTVLADIGDVTGKRGTVDFIMDATRGPTFTVDFTDDTANGKLKRKHHQQVIFDGKVITTKDFDPKEIMHNVLLPEGAKPGDAVSLNGPMPLPIGLDVEDVARNFEVTMLPAKNPDQAVLKLVPRKAGRQFDFTQLEVTVDKKQQLPVKMVQTQTSRDVVTIVLSDLEINQGKAKMESTATPAGWTERK